MMRAKFYVQRVELCGNCEIIHATPVTGKVPFGPNGESDDNTYARYTPSGSLSLTINNPALFGKIQPGQKYYLDFTEAAE